MADNTVMQTLYAKEFNKRFAVRQSYLRGMVQTQGEVKGNQFIFIVSGQIQPAVKRGSNGNIPYQADNQGSATCVLEEYFGQPLRKTGFNIFASSVDQRAQMQDDGISSINRTTDDMLIAEMGNTTVNTGAAAAATISTALTAIEKLDTAEVPNDGQRYALLTNRCWNQMLKITQFSSRDYVDAESLPFMKTTQWRFWNNIWWAQYPRLPGAGTNAAKCFIWHKSALGHGMGDGEFKPEIGFNEEHSYSWSHTRSYQGAKLLQTAGVVMWNHDDSIAL